MRLIDADALLEKYNKTTVWDSWVEINIAPTIDAVPVVRCKDCKYFLPYLTGCETTVEKADGNCGLLVLGDVQFTARQINDFCSYGERREANND